MNIRQWAFMVLIVTLVLIPSAGSLEGVDPLPDPKSHILRNGFRNTNPAFKAPSVWTRIDQLC